MDKEGVVYIYNGILLGNEKEWNLAICSNVDGTGECYSKWNKSGRERQIPYVFTHLWILRNLTEDHGGGEGEKKLQTGKEANRKRHLNTENKLRVDGGWGRGENGWWTLRRASVGMSTGCWLYGNQFDNKFHIKNKIKTNSSLLTVCQGILPWSIQLNF